MTRAHPEKGCYELAFQGSYPMNEPAEVALEDYARALTRSKAAEAVRADHDPAMVRGVHVCGLGTALTRPLVVDLEDFARSLLAPGGGLGWS